MVALYALQWSHPVSAGGSQEAATVTGEVPEHILARLRQDLLRRNPDGAEPALIRAASVVWPNGAMGCPRPGVNYTQATVEGYHVVFAQGEQRWDYRANRAGYFLLCDRAITIVNPPSQPNR